MNLSPRATNYLKRMNRNHHNCSSKEILKYLQNQNLQPLEHFFRFQIEYSGYELTIPNKTGDTFKAQLFSKNQVTQNLRPEIEKTDERLLLVCGDHKTAPFEFYLTDKANYVR